jgi:hypothetical protein
VLKLADLVDGLGFLDSEGEIADRLRRLVVSEAPQHELALAAELA